jgi:hypothetical protein
MDHGLMDAAQALPFSIRRTGAQAHASNAVLSPTHWSLTVSRSPSHRTNCNDAHAPGRLHLQPYKVQACQEKNSQIRPSPDADIMEGVGFAVT